MLGLSQLYKRLPRCKETNSNYICRRSDTDDNDESGGEEVIVLHYRIKDLNLEGTDAFWEGLTVEERLEFEAMINHGELGTIPPDWKPWWEHSVENEDVEVDELKKLERCPAHKHAPEMSGLTTVEHSKVTRNNIVNVLASYALILRLSRGKVDPVNWSASFLRICANLGQNTNFQKPTAAVDSVVYNCLRSHMIYRKKKKTLQVMKRDTFLILKGPSKHNPKHYCKSALSHVHRIISRARATVKKNPKIATQVILFDMTCLEIGKLRKALKKVEYYLSYLESFAMTPEED